MTTTIRVADFSPTETAVIVETHVPVCESRDYGYGKVANRSLGKPKVWFVIATSSNGERGRYSITDWLLT